MRIVEVKALAIYLHILPYPENDRCWGRAL